MENHQTWGQSGKPFCDHIVGPFFPISGCGRFSFFCFFVPFSGFGPFSTLLTCEVGGGNSVTHAIAITNR